MKMMTKLSRGILSIMVCTSPLFLTACATSTVIQKGDEGATAAVIAETQSSTTTRIGNDEPDIDENSSLPPAEDTVIDVLKGDELVMQSGWVVRLLDIDAPTADYGQRKGNYYGKQAMDYLKKRILGKKVTLTFDQKKVDNYGRALAYVSDSEGELNSALLKRGLALAVCFPPNVTRCDKYSKLARAAIDARKGLWNFDVGKWQEEKISKHVIKGVLVKEVLDGDTIKLDDGTIVRYIGIDAPESEAVWRSKAYGHNAYVLNRKLVEGKRVTLEYDLESTDPRGRELAWVYVGNKMINEALVEAGVAWVSVFPPNVRHIRTLFEAQERAARNKAGIWGSMTP